MAKKFLGFNPDQQFTILSKLGYQGPKDPKMMEAFVAATPFAAAKLGDYTKRAQELLNKPQMAEGGTVTTETATAPPAVTIPTGTTAQERLDTAQKGYSDALWAAASNPTDESAKTLADAQATLGVAKTAYKTTQIPTTAETIGQAISTPQSVLTQATPSKVATTPEQFIAPTEGQVGEVAPITATTVGPAEQAVAPEKTEAATVDATKATEGIKTELEGLTAVTAEPSKAATVQGQLESLMSQFEGGATPPWASGAMRQAMGIMQQRGLGASSIAGQAVVQAAMESALSIATQDAATAAQFEMQNLNNQQQTAIFKSQQLIASMFTDQAADNAAKQFNAASKNQVDQFFAGLQESVSRFNADQINSIAQFNAGQENVVEQFNASMQAQRDQFNAQNSLVIAQANAQWRQNIATLDSAAENEAMMTNVKAANGLTAAALDQIWQRERDLMSFAFSASENQAQRDVSLLIADKEIQAKVDLQNTQLDFQESAAKAQVFTSLIGSIFG